jgi:inner membrane protein
VLVADAAAPALRERRGVLGAVDEAAHLATGVLVLGRRPAAEVLAASVLIDADHVPKEWFGADWLTRGTPRPYTHSLATVAAAFALGRRAAALALLAHLLRDMSDPTTGVALLWPVSRRGLSLRQGAYHLAAGALAAR